MRGLVLGLCILFLMGAGSWAYRQNYETRDVFDRNRARQIDIAEAHQRLSMLRAEWAYLNRPDRLQDLVSLNFDRLGLLPLNPDQFARVSDLDPMPIAPDFAPDALIEAVPVSASASDVGVRP